MLKAVAGVSGNQCLVIGLSFGNIDRFLAAPMDTHIRIRREETGLPIEVVLFSGSPALQLRIDTQGNQILLLGLSAMELGVFKAKPMRAITKIDGRVSRLPFDIMLFSGRTELEMAEHFHDVVGPNTKITIDPRLTH
jgi:hypothetical protein